MREANEMARRFFRIRDLATTKSAAGLLPVSPATVWRWVSQGRFPAPLKLGANITVWDAESIEKFLAQRAEGQQA
jgi:predicted DNA-binding transcriptional regulator AlpA